MPQTVRRAAHKVCHRAMIETAMNEQSDRFGRPHVMGYLRLSMCRGNAIIGITPMRRSARNVLRNSTEFGN